MDDAALPLVGGQTVLAGLAVDNLRAIRMDSPVDLRRLMLVVGRNGIGKSTLARLFPLLRQSAGSRIREPLLWWEEDQVDFGSFHEAVRRGEREILFTFVFRLRDDIWKVSTALQANSQAIPKTANGASGTLPLGAPQNSRVAWVRVEQEKSWCQLGFDDEGALVRIDGCLDGDTFGEVGDKIRLLPKLYCAPWRLFGVPQENVEFYGSLLSLTHGLFHGNTDSRRRLEVVAGVEWRHPDGVINHFRSQHFGQAYKNNLAQLSKDKTRLRDIRLARFCWWAIAKLRQAEQFVVEIASDTAYLGPFRAVPQRGYRHQGVSVEQLDARGANLIMFVVALREDERDALNNFVETWLGFRIRVRPAGSQYELQIVLDGVEYNLVDVGFGYSQVLPVVVQLWAAGRILSTSRDKAPVSILVIEQPELHLHPHQQVLVARALAASAMEDSGPVLMIETHSDHLVGEVGLQVARGALSPDRVGVLCVEPHPTGGAAVRLATFDEDGILQNWPAGFLSP